MSAPKGDELTALVTAASGGESAALEQLVRAVQDDVYRLALRMVSQPADAEDATQEILVRVMTRLSTFRGEAAFGTWVHRIAVNHLLDRRKTAVERMEFSFDSYADDLQTGLGPPFSGPDAELLAEEVRLGCTQAMLTCLDRDLRVAYVLGEIFEVSSEEGAYICEIGAATYRKRLSRARQRIRTFVAGNCGVVNPDRAECRCARRVETAIALGRINPNNLKFSSHPVRQGVKEMQALDTAAGLMRSHPDYRAPEALVGWIRSLVRSGEFKLFDK